MRLIDADALIKDLSGRLMKEVFPDWDWLPAPTKNRVGKLGGAFKVAIEQAPTIEAEPVRHWGTTSIITTDDIDKYNSRIIIEEGENSKFCRVFYGDDREHGRWIHDINNLYGCSECMEKETMSPKKLKNYCPHCGAKMDGGAGNGNA